MSRRYLRGIYLVLLLVAAYSILALFTQHASVPNFKIPGVGSGDKSHKNEDTAATTTHKAHHAKPGPTDRPFNIETVGAAPPTTTGKHKEHGAIPEVDPFIEPAGPDGKGHLAAADAETRRNAFLASYVEGLVGLTPPIDTLEDYPKDLGDDIHRIREEKWNVTADLLKEYIKVTDEDVKILHDLHAKVVESIPELPEDLWTEERGIVLTGGGDYFPLLLAAVKWLLDRNQGVPIEIFMAEQEYEPDYCDDVFPKLGVHCRVVERIYGKDAVEQFDYMGYPLKVLALLASSFRHAYFMDVDALPLIPLKNIFDSPPYKDTGFILFPDYWARVTPPVFYDVAGIKLKEPAGYTKDPQRPLLMHQLEGAIPEPISTESGQMFVDKKLHYRSLFLSLYYNLNGFKHYFRLISVGPRVPGFGDKDTFVTAAHVLGENYYQVKEVMHTLGYFDVKSEFHGYAIVQHDPVSDYAYYHEGKHTTADKFANSPYLSLHANSLKLHPAALFSTDEKVMRGWKKVEKMRYFGPLSNVKEVFGSQDLGDIEKDMFDAVRYGVCQWMLDDNKVPVNMKSADIKQLCKLASEHVQFLNDNPEVL